MAQKQFEIGDWVRGKSREGELVHGFVESIDAVQGIIKIYVIDSDNEKVKGKHIWIFSKAAQKLPIVAAISETELLSLIDLSLLTKDVEWFRKLSRKLAFIKNNQNPDLYTANEFDHYKGLKNIDSK